MPRFIRCTLAALAALVAGTSFTLAQAEKRPLLHKDFDAWRTIAVPALSRDGRYLAYSYMPEDGNGDLVVRDLKTGMETRVPVGALPPPALPTGEEANPEAPPPQRNIRITFTSDSTWLVATTYPTKEDLAKARKDKKGPDDQPKGGLVFVALASGEVTRIADVKSMQVPSRGGAWVAYLKEAKPAEKKPATDAKAEEPAPETNDDSALALASADDTTLDPADQTRRAGARPAAGATGKKEYGTDLVLRNLAATGADAERTWPNALDYSFARDGKTLLFTVSARTDTLNGLFAVTPGDSADPVALLGGKGKYQKLTWDREQAQLAFVSDRDDAASKAPHFKAYRWQRGQPAATEIAFAASTGLPEGFGVSERGVIAFSRDGKKLYLPTAKPTKPARDPEAEAPEDRVSLDLWNWKDDLVQPMQKVHAVQERARTYRGELDLATGQFVQLADPSMATVTVSDDGARAIGQDDRAYRPMVDYDGRFADIYLVDAATGKRQLVIKQLRSEAGSALQWAPDGRHAAFYQDRHWHFLDVATGKTRPATVGLGVSFSDELDDHPEPPPGYGNAGWTRDSKSFVAYDRYDVWQLFPDNRKARNLTAGDGRKNKLQYRVQRIEPVEEDDDERGLDSAKPLVLRAESEDTRASGFSRTTFTATTAPQRLVWGNANYRYVARALEADVLLVTASRFDTFPDLQTTSSSFDAFKKVSDGAAQQKPFLWGSGELVKFHSSEGVPLQAALYKPANFDPKKKYPLIVYIYERLAQNVNTFVNPAPGHNINFALYTSNGYLVLTPDIVYQTGQPGQSALRCVLPAVDTVVKMGFVDERAIGIQGHSWGGYQVAYMVTQTNRFRAAEAGAPVGNMTSAYSGIRWGTGLPRQFQYEKTQSRIGTTLWDAPQKYLDNSAIFQIRKVQTPMLIIANDNDDAVPWYQGIEFFLALRRNAKEAYLFSYNGEFHALRRRADQKDYAMRMHQFFDHFLKGAPAPDWMEKGIPYTEREEEKDAFHQTEM